MRILVCGASGLLGATLVPYLVSQGYEIVRHGKHSGSDVSCDLTDKDAAHGLIKDVHPDIVVNLVALTNVDKCETNPHEAYLLNVRTVENLVSAMHGNTNSYLIHLSTDQVYDSTGLSREDGIRLTNTYALTKYAGEIAARHMPSTVLRTNFFGHSALTGRKSFSDWLLDCLRDGTQFTTFTDIVFNPLSMETLSALIARAVEVRIDGVFNLGSKGAMSKADFAFELASIYGLDTRNMRRGVSSEMALQAYRPKDMSMDCSSFEAAFDVALPPLKQEILDLKGKSGAITI